MTKELSKVIMTKSMLKNSYINWPSRENFLAYKKAKSKCNSTRKAKRKFLKEATKSGVISNRTFWKTVKPFLTIKDKRQMTALVPKKMETLQGTKRCLWYLLMKNT